MELKKYCCACLNHLVSLDSVFNPLPAYFELLKQKTKSYIILQKVGRAIKKAKNLFVKPNEITQLNVNILLLEEQNVSKLYIFHPIALSSIF